MLDTSNSSAVNQSRTYHLEESLVMAKSRSDRYEQELIAEMDRNTALARQSARLREENTALKEELRAANAKADEDEPGLGREGSMPRHSTRQGGM